MMHGTQKSAKSTQKNNWKEKKKEKPITKSHINPNQKSRNNHKKADERVVPPHKVQFNNYTMGIAIRPDTYDNIYFIGGA